jgi:hypothetical protein
MQRRCDDGAMRPWSQQSFQVLKIGGSGTTLTRKLDKYFKSNLVSNLWLAFKIREASEWQSHYDGFRPSEGINRYLFSQKINQFKVKG